MVCALCIAVADDDDEEDEEVPEVPKPAPVQEKVQEVTISTEDTNASTRKVSSARLVKKAIITRKTATHNVSRNTGREDEYWTDKIKTLEDVIKELVDEPKSRSAKKSYDPDRTAVHHETHSNSLSVASPRGKGLSHSHAARILFPSRSIQSEPEIVSNDTTYNTASDLPQIVLPPSSREKSVSSAPSTQRPAYVRKGSSFSISSGDYFEDIQEEHKGHSPTQWSFAPRLVRRLPLQMGRTTSSIDSFLKGKSPFPSPSKLSNQVINENPSGEISSDRGKKNEKSPHTQEKTYSTEETEETE